LCYWYLNDDCRVSNFFAAVQPNTNEKIQKIKGMTWNLLHLRNLEMMMTEENLTYAKVSLHYLITSDKRLVEIQKANPIKRMVTSGGSAHVLRKFEIPNLINELYCEAENETKIQEFFQDTRENRNKVKNLNGIDKVIISLEKELLNI